MILINIELDFLMNFNYLEILLNTNNIIRKNDNLFL